MTYRVEKHLWWNADKTVLVPSGDPDAAFLAYPAGDDITDEQARAAGLLPAGPPPRSPEEVAEAKLREAAPQNKGRTPASNKAAKSAPEEIL